MTTKEQSANGAVEAKFGKKISKLTKILPTDRIAYPKQLEILRAFAVAGEHSPGEDVTTEATGKIVTMAPTTIVQAIAFFCDVGFLHRSGQGFTVAKEVMDFQKSHGWNAQTAGQKLAPLLSPSWFAQVIMQRLKLREIDEAEAVQVLAEESSAGKAYEVRIRMLLDYLATAEIILREDGKLKLASTSPALPVAPTAAQQIPATSAQTQVFQPAPSDVASQDPDLEQHTLTLDAQKKRRVIIKTPHMVSRAELKRIQEWLGYQLLISDEEKTTG